MLLEQIIIEILKEQDASVEELALMLQLNPKLVAEIFNRLLAFGVIDWNSKIPCS